MFSRKKHQNNHISNHSFEKFKYLIGYALGRAGLYQVYGAWYHHSENDKK